MNKWFPTRLIMKLDQEIARRWPMRRGWFLFDAASRNPPLLVHERSYLRDKEGMPGFRMEPVQGDPFESVSGDDYVFVFASTNACEEVEQPSATALELMLKARRQSLPQITIGFDPETDAIKVNEEGEAKPLRTDAPPIGAERIELTIEGDRAETVTRFLPFEIEVAADAPEAFLTIRAPENAGFSRMTYSFLLSTKNKPLGPGRLQVDVNLRPGYPDSIRLLASGFSAKKVDCQEWSKPPGVAATLRFDRKPLTLHLLYDRTCLDAESWPSAVAAADDLLQSEAAGFGPPTINPQHWNRRWREELARALPQALDDLHHDVSLHLWWFADMTRDGIAHRSSLPVQPNSWGQVGTCTTDTIAEQLGAPSFDYAFGLDLFDAADEALAQIVNSIRRNRGVQQAVLIVGDSPPPPRDPDDSLWQHLVERPVRTSARRSPLFRQALQELREMEVPAAWLFLRAAPPSAEAPYREFAIRHFPAFQTLKVKTLEALQQIDGLLVEDCERPAEMDRSLGKLFKQIKHGNPEAPAFQIVRILS